LNLGIYHKWLVDKDLEEEKFRPNMFIAGNQTAVGIIFLPHTNLKYYFKTP
jgi:hypothetical protein